MFVIKKKWQIFSLLIVVSLFLSACATPTPKVVEKVVTQVVKETVVVEGTPQVVEKVVTVPPEKWTGRGFGGTLNAVLGGAPPTADVPTTSAAATQILAIHVHETLVAFSEDYKPIPMVAKSWDISDEGKTYTFHLRQGKKFHNGQEVTAEDVVASYNRFVEISPRAPAFAEVVESVEATDKYTVVIKLVHPSRMLLTNLAMIYAALPIQPKSVIEGKAGGELAVPEDIIGCGPYKLKEYNPDTLIVLERFEDYEPLPGERDGMGGAKIPYLDEIRYHIVPEYSAQLAGLEAGQYDLIGLLASDFARFEEHPDIEAFHAYPGEIAVMLFNHREQYTKDVKFRQAILAALDMKEIGLYEAGGDPEGVRANPYLWPVEGGMYLPNDPVAESHYNQNDPEKAKQLLKEAGYEGEELVWVTTRDYESLYLMAVATADQLEKKLDMPIKIEVLDWTSMNARWEEPSGWHFTNTGYSSFQYFPMVLDSYWNCNAVSAVRCGYCNPQLDAAFKAADAALTAEEEEAAFREVQRIFWEDLPNIKIYDRPSYGARLKDLAGYTPWYRDRFFGVWKEK